MLSCSTGHCNCNIWPLLLFAAIGADMQMPYTIATGVALFDNIMSGEPEGIRHDTSN